MSCQLYSAFTKKGAFTVSSMSVVSSHLKQTQFTQKELKRKKTGGENFLLETAKFHK